MNRRRSRNYLYAGLVVGGLFGGLEWYARRVLGLGDPPLSVADPAIEYLFKPNQQVRRFGHSIRYNAYSMRSEDFVEKEPGERRVVMLGDSVLNGGGQTDDADLATTLASTALSASLGKKVRVCNASAGSWGPPNMAAYVRRFGLFEADAVGLVLNSGDAWDVRTFEPIVGVHPGFPDTRPLLAVAEGFTRYLLPKIRSSVAPSDPLPPAGDRAGQSVQVMTALRESFRAAEKIGARPFVVVHRNTDEWASQGMPEGEKQIRLVAEQAHVPVYLLQLDVKTDYRDNIHVNESGQRKLGQLLEQVIRGTVMGKSRL